MEQKNKPSACFAGDPTAMFLTYKSHQESLHSVDECSRSFCVIVLEALFAPQGIASGMKLMPQPRDMHRYRCFPINGCF